jgi:membrane-associated protein
MEWLRSGFDLFIHIDEHIGAVISQYGTWTYAIMFVVLFCETGLVVTPVLPGDSLLFTLGAFAAQGALSPWWLGLVLFVAVCLGDNVNYWIGYHVGPKIFSGKKIRWLNVRHLEETQRFYERHGGKTIILARFIPIIRTFAPFVAGIGRMPYGNYLRYSLGGGLVWISLGIGAGYVFGNIPAVQDNFTLVLVAIVGISLLPALIKYWQHRHNSRQPQLPIKS